MSDEENLGVMKVQARDLNQAVEEDAEYIRQMETLKENIQAAEQRKGDLEKALYGLLKRSLWPSTPEELSSDLNMYDTDLARLIKKRSDEEDSKVDP